MLGFFKTLFGIKTTVVHEHVYSERPNREPPPRQHGSNTKDTNLGCWN